MVLRLILGGLNKTYNALLVFHPLVTFIVFALVMVLGSLSLSRYAVNPWFKAAADKRMKERRRRIAADAQKTASTAVPPPMVPLNGSSVTGAPVPSIPASFEASGIGFPVRSESIPSIQRSQISKVKFDDTIYKPTLDLSEEITSYDIKQVHKNADIKANGMVLQPIVDPDNSANGRLKMEFNDYERYPDLQWPIRPTYDTTRVYDGLAIPKAEPSTAANPPMKMIQSGTVYPLSLNNLPTNDFFE